jgi:hypothetical protein
MSHLSSHRPFAHILGAFLALAVLAGAAQAQPFGGFLILQGNSVAAGAGHGYVRVPHSPGVNPTGAITIEMWVKLKTPFTGQTCRSLIGKDFTEAYWLGVCTSTLRSYIRGGGSSHDGGEIPRDRWTHIAVTSDGTTVRHIINGVEVAHFSTTGGPTPSPDELRIGSDVSWQFSPQGNIDEVRLWNIARTPAEISAAMNAPISTPQAGLVAVWSFDGNTNDIIGPFDGTLQGTATLGANPVPPDGNWMTSPTLPGFRFKARITPPSGTPIVSTQVTDCVPETVCAAGALADRTEIFLRVIGPRPNGFLWAQVIRFTPSFVEVWVEKTSTGQINYYDLESIPTDSDALTGLVHKTAFLP